LNFSGKTFCYKIRTNLRRKSSDFKSKNLKPDLDDKAHQGLGTAAMTPTRQSTAGIVRKGIESKLFEAHLSEHLQMPGKHWDFRYYLALHLSLS
jgi:hypothetical protein